MTARLFRIAAPALVLALIASASEAETYIVDVSHSVVDFSIRHLVGRTKGRFTEFTGAVVYDAAKPKATKITGTVQVSSIDTDNDRRDGHLQSADFCDVANHPTITFESTKVTRTADGTLDVVGNLSMHGITKQVQMPVEVLGTGPNPMNGKAQAGFAGTHMIKCSDFGVNSWEKFEAILGDEV